MIAKYYNWLHGKWPAGTVEKLPVVGEQGVTNVDGIRIVGDLSGVPLLKFSSETGVQAIRGILEEGRFSKEKQERGAEDYDVAIIGAGVSGISAAMEAEKAGLKYVLFETSQVFNTVENFPKGKFIFTYPTDMTPAGGIQYGENSDKRESLLKDMKKQMEEANVEVTSAQITHVEKKGSQVHVLHGTKKGETPKVTKALRCIIAIGRSGNYRKMGISGEGLDKVMNRLHDPKDYCEKQVVIVGGGDSAAEAAIALAVCGAHVTLSYRGDELTRPKPENVDKLFKLAENPETPMGVDSPSSERVTTAANSEMRGDKPAGSLVLALGTNPVEVAESTFTFKEGKDGEQKEIENDAVFAMIGREAPLDFFRRSGVNISGERNTQWWVTAGLSVLFFTFLYLWKNGDANLDKLGVGNWAWPKSVPEWIAGLGGWWKGQVDDRSSLLGTIAVSMKSRSFYYTLVYCILVTTFGIRRIKRRKTPYVTRQTTFLMVIQWLPLFIIPEVILPFAGYNGAFAHGSWWDGLFDPYIGAADYAAQNWPDWGHPRAYWRAYGFILAWPLFVYNFFTKEPMMLWLIIGSIQTFVIIPLIVMRWGKGAYCGWVCSCGGLAETLGDAHRHKMPHGPKWNKLNMIGQVFLWAAAILFILRIIGWIIPGDDAVSRIFESLEKYDGKTLGGYFSYAFIVDLLFAGIIGVAFYFHLSGRVWCRFACPLAALMHIYSRFGKFRIFPEKKKCISCNVCTSVCHQGIDVMNFANKGIPMEDPECVRCSACVQQCPTGVLQFGRIGKDGDPVLDGLKASPVQMKEK